MNYAGFLFLCVAHGASLMHLFAGEADVSRSDGIILIGNNSILIVSTTTCASNFPTLLRRVVLIG